MLSTAWGGCAGVSQEVRNIIMHRVTSLVGIDMVEEEEGGSMADLSTKLLEEIGPNVQQLRERLSRCVVVAEHQTTQ